MNLDDATMRSWAQVLIDAIENPVAIMFGIAIAGAIILRVRSVM